MVLLFHNNAVSQTSKTSTFFLVYYSLNLNTNTNSQEVISTDKCKTSMILKVSKHRYSSIYNLRKNKKINLNSGPHKGCKPCMIIVCRTKISISVMQHLWPMMSTCKLTKCNCMQHPSWLGAKYTTSTLNQDITATNTST